MASRWAPRRSTLVVGALLVAALAVLVLQRSSSQAASDGSAYDIPDVVDTDPRPDVVSTTIVADEANVRVSDIGNGITAHAQTYNGTIPGPTFHLKVGDTVIVHFVNHLNRETGIHWHGIELSNGMDGTPFTQNQVEPGGNFLYKFTVTRPGLFWYHPHHHSSTNQVFKGLYGMIIVKDPNEDALQASGKLPSDADTHPIVLSDTTVCKDPGSNDSHAYADNVSSPGNTQPWSGGGIDTLPPQQDPNPKNLCEGPDVAPNDYPIDEDGNPRSNFQQGDIPNIQTALHHGRTNEG